MACDPVPTEAALTFAAGNFQPGYCPNSYQQLANDIAEALSGSLSGNFVGWSVGSTKPTDHNRPWMKLDANCNFERIYFFGEGSWRAPHPDFVGKVIMYAGLETDVPTLDGGDNGALTASTGPMWTIITEMAGRSPMGPGTLPDTTALALGVNAGGSSTLTIDQIPSHKHLEIGEFTPDQDVYNAANGTEIVAGSAKGIDGTAGNHDDRIQGYTSSVGGGLAIPILSPVRGIWFLKKTSRIWYTLPA